MAKSETLKSDLTAIFGSGKSFSAEESDTIKAGTEIIREGVDTKKRGYYFFSAKEFGRWSLYCVKTEAELNAALGEGETGERQEVIDARNALAKLTSEELATLLSEMGK